MIPADAERFTLSIYWPDVTYPANVQDVNVRCDLTELSRNLAMVTEWVKQHNLTGAPVMIEIRQVQSQQER